MEPLLKFRLADNLFSSVICVADETVQYGGSLGERGSDVVCMYSVSLLYLEFLDIHDDLQAEGCHLKRESIGLADTRAMHVFTRKRLKKKIIHGNFALC